MSPLHAYTVPSPLPHYLIHVTSPRIWFVFFSWSKWINPSGFLFASKSTSSSKKEKNADARNSGNRWRPGTGMSRNYWWAEQVKLEPRRARPLKWYLRVTRKQQWTKRTCLLLPSDTWTNRSFFKIHTKARYGGKSFPLVVQNNFTSGTENIKHRNVF